MTGDPQQVNRFFRKYLDDATLNAQQQQHKDTFLRNGILGQEKDLWKNFPWEKIINNDYTVQQGPEPYQPVDNFFHCEIHNIDSHLFTFLNGWYLHNNVPLTIYPNGVTVGSYCQAMKQFPDLIDTFISQFKKQAHSSLVDIAAALCHDGLFVYVPDGIELTSPIQMVNIVKTDKNLFINNKNLVLLGKNASLKFIHCDDTLQSGHTLINTATEFFLQEGARLDFYKLENKDNASTLINDLTIYQSKDTTVNTDTNVFNGGLVHNSINAHLLGKGSTIHLNGLYLVDKKQEVFNNLSVNHFESDCVSRQLYNGILDEEAQAHFLGHVFVAPDAQKTEASQTNHNILLTDQATINTRPFLEIYADDVKCSHGATVGQLDNDAVFYLRSRGICEKNAKTLLMHAFAKEVIDKISLEALVNYTEDLVQKRLSGQNISCGSCSMACENKPIEFDIQVPEL